MLLPPSSLCAITTRKLAAPSLLWIAHDCFSSELALAHAYCIADPAEPASGYDNEERVASADRYGGPGIGYSGGSGRCATFGDIQIKGIGRTPLVTKKTDPFHSNGLVGMVEAIREIIWSEIAHSALPFGAVRTLAALDTNMGLPVAAPGAPLTRNRILLLREWALRPAHYMRNVFFDTALVPQYGVVEDALRTCAAVGSLVLTFRSMFAACEKAEQPIDVINCGLREAAHRYAAQVGTATSKRIFHGGLTPSNIALDGKYIDFGTITAVPMSRRRAIRPLEPDFWNEHELLFNTLIDVRFYIGKYAGLLAHEKFISVQELSAVFSTTINTTQQSLLLRRTGVPASIATLFPPEKRLQFQRCALQIQRRSADEPFVNWTGASSATTMPSRAGRYSLDYLFTVLATCANEAAVRTLLSKQLDDPSLADEFATLYVALVALLESSLPDPGAVRTGKLLMAIDAVRMNADLSFLCDVQLNATIGACFPTAGAIEALVGPAVGRAHEILNDSVDIAGRVQAYLAHLHGELDGRSLLTHVLPHNATFLPAGTAENLEAVWNTAH